MFRCSLGTATYFSAACTPAGPSGDIVVMNQPNWYLFAKPTPPWIALVVWHQRAVGHVRSELDQARQVRRLRSGGPRAHHCFHPECAAPSGCAGRVLSEALN